MTTTTAQLAAEANVPADHAAAILDMIAEHILRPAVERFGDVDRAAAALAVLFEVTAR